MKFEVWANWQGQFINVESDVAGISYLDWEALLKQLIQLKPSLGTSEDEYDFTIFGLDEKGGKLYIGMNTYISLTNTSKKVMNSFDCFNTDEENDSSDCRVLVRRFLVSAGYRDIVEKRLKVAEENKIKKIKEQTVYSIRDLDIPFVFEDGVGV